mgnify:CR=1 FL=1
MALAKLWAVFVLILRTTIKRSEGEIYLLNKQDEKFAARPRL